MRLALGLHSKRPLLYNCMRKITSTTCHAFLGKARKTSGNTSTNGSELYLHGNRIAWHVDGGIMITLAGWPTVTTRERLNGLAGVSVNQARGTQYLNGEAWDGSPKFIAL